MSDFAGTFCALCGSFQEPTVHLFCGCVISSHIWFANISWLSFDFVISQDILSLFWQFTYVGGPARCRRDLTLIWHTVLWVIWDLRNCFMFFGVAPHFRGSIDSIRSLSWRWFQDRSTSPSCLFMIQVWASDILPIIPDSKIRSTRLCEETVFILQTLC